MGKVSSPSDFTNIDVDYAAGKGYYTTHSDISNLLQIGVFTANTTPNLIEIGKLIKRVEEKIDDSIKSSYRPIIYKDEFHSFDTMRLNSYPISTYKDYVGFVQLSYPKVQKLVRLEVYQGDTWKDLASASATLIVPDSTTTNDWTISLTVGNPTTYTFEIKNLANNSIRHFYDNFGPKTTASQIVDAINEVYPMKTAKFTGETAKKTITANGAPSVHVSDFFYATLDSENKKRIVISSLLEGEDGTYCGLSSTYGSVTSFTDNQNSGRQNDYWTMNDEGKIFFRQEYPHNHHHSIRVTYVAGEGRVPAPIHEAATKIVAAEIIRHDDNSILIAETGSNIDLKAKHDILLEEANAILKGKQNIVHFIL
jgi:hypothetical protein